MLIHKEITGISYISVLNISLCLLWIPLVCFSSCFYRLSFTLKMGIVGQICLLRRPIVYVSFTQAAKPELSRWTAAAATAANRLWVQPLCEILLLQFTGCLRDNKCCNRQVESNDGMCNLMWAVFQLCLHFHINSAL